MDHIGALGNAGLLAPKNYINDNPAYSLRFGKEVVLDKV
jgi:hypothetical protein